LDAAVTGGDVSIAGDEADALHSSATSAPKPVASAISAPAKANCERDKPKATIAATYWLLCV
jgi:hypothetical protein